MAVRTDVDAVLGSYASRYRYLYQSRLKDRESYLQKLETGRFADSDFDDVLGCTLIVPTPSAIDTCIRALPAALEVLGKRGPDTRNKEPTVFRFDEWILKCRLSRANPASGVGRPFELQVTTVTLHAWSRATHDLVYKGDRIDWRRERLAAQLRALAEQADLLYSEFLRVSPSIPQGRSDNSRSLLAVGLALQRWIDGALIPKARIPSSRVRFAESLVDLGDATKVSTRRILAQADRWLRRNPYPVSLSPYQVCLGAILETETIDWALAPPRFRVLATSEALDVFPRMAGIPGARTVELRDD
jgi:hypothetical protein